MTTVRHLITGNTGTVQAETELGTEFAGDMAGTWYNVTFDDGLTCWVQASSVEEVPA